MPCCRPARGRRTRSGRSGTRRAGPDHVADRQRPGADDRRIRVSVSNVAFTGANVAAGEFSGGGTGSSAIIGFDQGVVLSTGATGSVVGPNTSDTITTENGTAGDGDLDGLLPPEQSTQDASVLTFDFTPNASEISLDYVFASDEYNEFVGQGFNDVFGSS